MQRAGAEQLFTSFPLLALVWKMNLRAILAAAPCWRSVELGVLTTSATITYQNNWGSTLYLGAADIGAQEAP